MSRADLLPTSANSARFLLERLQVAEGGTRASYRAAILTADKTYEGTATLGDDGSTELALEGASAELFGKLQMFAKLLARGAAKRRIDGLAVWPARVQRWRPTAGSDGSGDD
jgi:hypothetical protein